ncbi:MAG: carboxysome shell carbonic anhydrase [Gammaproteobacteria bacterium]|nr:carboxysome shell carbonic anhydrase [Gammaproteobacteria bacterium]
MKTSTHTWRRHAAGTYSPGAYDATPALTDPYIALFGQSPPVAGSVASVGAHPLYDAVHNRRLLERESEITAAFAAIEPALKDAAALQYQEGAADRIQQLVRGQLGFELPVSCLQATWARPLNMRRLYAYCVFQTFRRLADRNFDRSHADLSDGEPADEVIRKWGFHAIDITPCADGRLSGVVDYILRVPPAVVVHRKSFAGSMFDVEESMRNWEQIELRRYREGVPNAAGEPTRYLKIGMYHFSSSRPNQEGCAAHGSDERKAAQALLDRLNDFARAIENSHCCGAAVATLLVGVDTDNDAIKVHVPDVRGEISLERCVDNRVLFERTASLSRDEAKEAIRLAVADAAGVSPDDAATEGMRWFCAYLLKNNMAQIDYVRAWHNGCYADLGHTERFITVGDNFDDVQMRNLAYQAQMETIEEGAGDMDVGIKIFRKVNMAHDLPIPAFIHFRYDGRVPDSRDRAVARCRRLRCAIESRYSELVREGWLYTYGTVGDSAAGSKLEDVDTQETPDGQRCACGCKKSESRQ